MPELMPVASTRIIEYGYDPDAATVYVRFPNGKGWQYRNVPQSVWDDFVAAESKGRFVTDVLDHYDNGPADI
jgi:hypothetical protein